MRIIIAGTRTFDDYALLSFEVTMFVLEHSKNLLQDLVIISGTASGADKLGELFAESIGVPCERFPADWGTYGKSAGYRRNVEMANNADAAIIFWDGVSRGTKHMIDIATEKGLLLKVIRY